MEVAHDANSKQAHTDGVELDVRSQDNSPPDSTSQPRRSFRSFIWDTDTHLKSPEEQRLLLKLDVSILTIGCLGKLQLGSLHPVLLNTWLKRYQSYESEYN